MCHRPNSLPAARSAVELKGFCLRVRGWHGCGVRLALFYACVAWQVVACSTSRVRCCMSRSLRAACCIVLHVACSSRRLAPPMIGVRLHTATLHVATLLVACCNIACYLLLRRSFGEFGKERLLRGGLTFHAAELVDEAAVADEVHC